MLPDFGYFSPSAAWITSHSSVVLVLTKATRTSCGSLGATSHAHLPEALGSLLSTIWPASLAAASKPLPLLFLHWSPECLFLKALSPCLLLGHTLSRGLNYHLPLLQCTSEHPVPTPPALSLAFPRSSLGHHSNAPEAPPTQCVQSDLGTCPPATLPL